jgi:hypothetical protein
MRAWCWLRQVAAEMDELKASLVQAGQGVARLGAADSVEQKLRDDLGAKQAADMAAGEHFVKHLLTRHAGLAQHMHQGRAQVL